MIEMTYRRRFRGDSEALPADFRIDGRPIVAIDPEDPEQVERLGTLIQANGGPFFGEIRRAALRAALRQFADPKPNEPQGLGAVVELADGRRAVRVPSIPSMGPRWLYSPLGEGTTWEHLDAVKVLSEGVEVDG